MKNRSPSTLVTLIALATAALAAAPAAHAYGAFGPGRHDVRHRSAYAQQIDARQDRQRDRIHAAMHEGRLNRAEVRTLMHEQRRIQAMEHRFRADDGRIDAREFHRLDRALDRASRNIRAEGHDRQRFADAGGWHR